VTVTCRMTQPVGFFGLNSNAATNYPEE
jgi:hypothetical protein